MEEQNILLLANVESQSTDLSCNLPGGPDFFSVSGAVRMWQIIKLWRLEGGVFVSNSTV